MQYFRYAAWMLPIALVLTGCGRPDASFDLPRCRLMGEAGRLKTLSFTADLRTAGIREEQLMVHARVLDRQGRPLKAKHRQYRTDDGSVSATRSVMILTSAPSPITLSIPVSEIDLSREDLPIRGELRVVRHDGTELARAYCAIPIVAKRRTAISDGAATTDQ